MRKPYPSDITREQFEFIRRSLEAAKKKTRPRDADLYEMFCACLYRLKTGCQWRALPHDFPDYRHVNYYWNIWTKKDESGQSLLDCLLVHAMDAHRDAIRENSEPTLLIADSKTSQNADCANEKGYDGGKKNRV